MREMKARFNGKCKGCGGQIGVGDTINWSRETGALCGNGGCLDAYWGSEFGRHEAAQERSAYEAEMRQERGEYARGRAEVAAIQAQSEAGSALREALYLQLDRQMYDEGY